VWPRRTQLSAIIAAVLALASAAPAWAQGGLAQTPPMGWNSWRHFGCNVSEALIRQTADALVASGMREAGYAYVVRLRRLRRVHGSRTTAAQFPG
jgi:alpha-galactosidase